MVTDLQPEEAWDLLINEANSCLVDVRTTGEWHYVGGPDLTKTGKACVRISWHIWPQLTENPDFPGELERAAAQRDMHLVFLCRSGGRSLAAARKAQEAGWTNVYNVLGGFEGELDATGRRGTSNGWKAARLPWRQT
ncbi:MAG: rhodanese-like domain-containing protein [Hyphomicrobiales bacterium]|nr:rhodanese-like domain-containing protein [Hyphomicrobiales bacterium]